MSINNSKPNYQLERPAFSAITKLWSNLQEQDSCLQTNQIAIEYLQENIELTNVNENIFVNALAKKYRISSGSTSWDENKIRISKSYIVQTYNIVEDFCKELIDEIKFYKNIKENKWVNKVKEGSSYKNIDYFNQINLNLNEMDRAEIINKPEYHLIDYYRKLRNNFVHSQGKKSKKLDLFYEKRVLPKLDYFAGYYKFIEGKIPAPNPPDRITYRDFILYSRAIRYFSYHISNLWKLNGKEIYTKHKDDPFFKESLATIFHQKGINQEKRVKRIELKIESFLKGRFRVSTPEDVKMIFKLFSEDRIPSRKSRRHKRRS